MKLFIFLLLSLPFSHAVPLTVTDIFATVSARLQSSDAQKKPNKEDTFYLWDYPTDKPRDFKNIEAEWASSQITVFSIVSGEVKQIALESYGCNIEQTESATAPVRARFVQLIEKESKAIFGKALKIKESIFKEMNPLNEKPSRIKVTESLPGVKRMNLRGGVYKCDGRSGYGYRFDFFLGSK